MPFRPRLESIAGSDGLAQPVDIAKPTEGGALLDADPTNQRILELVVEMGNMVIFKRAAGELLQIKQKGGYAAFTQPRLFRKVLSLLECRHYRLPVRRMVLELFDKSVLRSIIFDEEEEEEEDSDLSDDGRDKGGASKRVDDSEEEDNDDEDEEEDDDNDDDERRAVGAGEAAGSDESDEDQDEDEDSTDEESGAGVAAESEGKAYRPGNGAMNSGDESSGDEQRTERQRSISDPVQLQRRDTARRLAV